MVKIELKAKKLSGFSKDIALRLIEKKIEAYKHYWRWCERQGISQDYCSKGYAEENYSGGIDRLKTQFGQEESLKSFQEVKKALREKRLLLRCIGGLSWSVAIVGNGKIEGISLINQKALCRYPLNYEKGAYTMACYGTSRPLEIILAYGYALGLEFGDIPQSQQIN